MCNLDTFSSHRYLPTDEPAQREAITTSFWEYNKLCRDTLWAKYGCHQHWAKIELPDSPTDLEWVRDRLRKRFPIDYFSTYLSARDLTFQTLTKRL